MLDGHFRWDTALPWSVFVCYLSLAQKGFNMLPSICPQSYMGITLLRVATTSKVTAALVDLRVARGISELSAQPILSLNSDL